MENVARKAKRERVNAPFIPGVAWCVGGLAILPDAGSIPATSKQASHFERNALRVLIARGAVFCLI